MSIVIPAGHLARTVIIVRCDSPHAAPHIECALDEQTPFGNIPRESLRSSPVFSTDGRSTASSSTAPPSPSGSFSMPQADLSVERGMDHRGHYVRLSFLPGHRSTHRYGRQPLGQEIADTSYLSLGNALSGPTPSLGLSQGASPFRPAANIVPLSMGGSSFANSSMSTMNVSAFFIPLEQQTLT